MVFLKSITQNSHCDLKILYKNGSTAHTHRINLVLFFQQHRNFIPYLQNYSSPLPVQFYYTVPHFLTWPAISVPIRWKIEPSIMKFLSTDNCQLLKQNPLFESFSPEGTCREQLSYKKNNILNNQKCVERTELRPILQFVNCTHSYKTFNILKNNFLSDASLQQIMTAQHHLLLPFLT